MSTKLNGMKSVINVMSTKLKKKKKNSYEY
jgi:hypothetical protein